MLRASASLSQRKIIKENHDIHITWGHLAVDVPQFLIPLPESTGVRETLCSLAWGIQHRSCKDRFSLFTPKALLSVSVFLIDQRR